MPTATRNCSSGTVPRKYKPTTSDEISGLIASSYRGNPGSPVGNTLRHDTHSQGKFHARTAQHDPRHNHPAVTADGFPDDNNPSPPELLRQAATHLLAQRKLSQGSVTNHLCVR